MSLFFQFTLPIKIFKLGLFQYSIFSTYFLFKKKKLFYKICRLMITINRCKDHRNKYYFRQLSFCFFHTLCDSHWVYYLLTIYQNNMSTIHLWTLKPLQELACTCYIGLILIFIKQIESFTNENENWIWTLINSLNI